jgi:glycosyltransferase 2 family protein
VLHTKIPGWAGLGRLSLTRASMCGQWLYYSASVCAVGVAFYFFVSAFHPLEASALLPLTGSLAAATVIGFLVPLAPNGWGIREGILVFLLAQFVPTSVAVMVSVTSRIWLALVEAVWVILLVALTRLLRTTAPTAPADQGDNHAVQSGSEDYHEISEVR